MYFDQQRPARNSEPKSEVQSHVNEELARTKRIKTAALFFFGVSAGGVIGQSVFSGDPLRVTFGAVAIITASVILWADYRASKLSKALKRADHPPVP